LTAGSCNWQNTFENLFYSEFRACTIVFSRLVVDFKQLCLWINQELFILDQVSRFSDLQRVQGRFNGKPANACMCENTVNNIHKSIFLLCCPINASHVQFLEDLFKYHRKLVSKTEFRNIFLVRKIRTSFSKNTIDQKWETHNHPEKKMY